MILVLDADEILMPSVLVIIISNKTRKEKHAIEQISELAKLINLVINLSDYNTLTDFFCFT